MTPSGREGAARDLDPTHLDESAGSPEPPVSELEIEVVTVDGHTTYRVNGREYPDFDALPPLARRVLADRDLGVVASASGAPAGRADLTPEGLRLLTGRGPGVALQGEPVRDEVDRGRSSTMSRRGVRQDSFVLEDVHPADDPFLDTTRAIERGVGAIARWAACFALIGWAWMEPESLGPFIFLGFLIADFVTWVAETGLATWVWRSRPFHPRSVGLSLLGFGVMYGLLVWTESFQVAPQDMDWARTVTMIAFFFTLCGKTIAIGLRRASEITRGA